MSVSDHPTSGDTDDVDLTGHEPAVDVTAEEEGDELVAPHDRRPDSRVLLREPLSQRPTVRAGAYAWAFIGLGILVVIAGFLVAQLSTVIVPIIIALFPAAVLQPPTDWLKARRVPDALAAAIVLLGTIGVVTLIVTLIAPPVAAQLDSLRDSIEMGYAQLDDFLASGPFGLQPIQLDDLIAAVTDQLRTGNDEGGGVAGNALGVARAFFETATSTLLMFIVLFFFLMDGRRIAEWVKSVFPHRLHEDVAIIGSMGWRTIGGYIQGQLMVAVVDAVFIGLGLFIVGVELALPLAVIVFFGGLFPVVGAGIAGFLAALVALATNGPGTAALVIGIVLGVQFLEGQLLQPLILGRTLSIHPLAIIVALTVGGFLLGILGAFLAVPVAAASAQTVGYLRRRIPG